MQAACVRFRREITILLAASAGLKIWIVFICFLGRASDPAPGRTTGFRVLQGPRGAEAAAHELGPAEKILFRSVISAALDCLDRESGKTARSSADLRTSIVPDPRARVWHVYFLAETPPDVAKSCGSLIAVNVSGDLVSTFEGVISW